MEPNIVYPTHPDATKIDKPNNANKFGINNFFLIEYQKPKTIIR